MGWMATTSSTPGFRPAILGEEHFDLKPSDSWRQEQRPRPPEWRKHAEKAPRSPREGGRHLESGQGAGRGLILTRSVDRQFISPLDALLPGRGRALRSRPLRDGVFRPRRFNFIAIAVGFVFQKRVLSIRGHALGRCPITNSLRSVHLPRLVAGADLSANRPAYRLSLMGAFTAPLVCSSKVRPPGAESMSPSRCGCGQSVDRIHASISMMAYGAFALACVAGVCTSSRNDN